MQIEYVVTKSKRNVPDAIGSKLIANGLARRVNETRELKAESASQATKPKRRYKRRDMRAEG